MKILNLYYLYYRTLCDKLYFLHDVKQFIVVIVGVDPLILVFHLSNKILKSYKYSKISNLN